MFSYSQKCAAPELVYICNEEQKFTLIDEIFISELYYLITIEWQSSETLTHQQKVELLKNHVSETIINFKMVKFVKTLFPSLDVCLRRKMEAMLMK